MYQRFCGFAFVCVVFCIRSACKKQLCKGDIKPCVLERKIWEGVLAFREEKVQEIQGGSSGYQAGGGIYVLTPYFYAKSTANATISELMTIPKRSDIYRRFRIFFSLLYYSRIKPCLIGTADHIARQCRARISRGVARLFGINANFGKGVYRGSVKSLFSVTTGQNPGVARKKKYLLCTSQN